MRKKTVISAALLTAAFAAGGLMYVIYGPTLQKADAAPAPPKVPIVAATVAQHDVPI
jgi:membrane fusion protein, multidrug efflux system